MRIIDILFYFLLVVFCFYEYFKTNDFVYMVFLTLVIGICLIMDIANRIEKELKEGKNE